MTVLTIVGWTRGDDLGRQYFCPPHVPESQRTLGEPFTSVSSDRALRCSARCATCGELLATGDVPSGGIHRRADTFRDLVREANAMLGLAVDPASEWGDWRQRVAVVLSDEHGAKP